MYQSENMSRHRDIIQSHEPRDRGRAVEGGGGLYDTRLRRGHFFGNEIALSKFAYVKQ